jgi:hypothetical protein
MEDDIWDYGMRWDYLRMRRFLELAICRSGDLWKGDLKKERPVVCGRVR